MIRIIMIVCLIAGGMYFAFTLAKDLIKTRDTWKHDKGSIRRYAIIECLVMFFACFGISDSAMNIFSWKVFDKNVPDRLLPGTLICTAVIPFTFISVSYCSTIEVDPLTLVLLSVIGSVGSILGVRVIANWNEHMIRKIMGAALILSAVLILIKVLLLSSSSDTGTITLPLPRLIIACVLFFIFGAFNMVGVGASVPNMAILMLLGMNTGSIYAINLSVCTFEAIFGGITFIRQQDYYKKLPVSSLFSIPFVLLGVYVFNMIRNFDIRLIQYLLVILLIYCSQDLLRKEFGKKAQ